MDRILPFLKLLARFLPLEIILANNLLYSFRFLSPLSAVPLVALSGFGLYELGFPVVLISATRTSPYFFPTCMNYIIGMINTFLIMSFEF